MGVTPGVAGAASGAGRAAGQQPQHGQAGTIISMGSHITQFTPWVLMR